MDVRKIVLEEIRKVLKENYPLGAAQESNPWNQEYNTRAGEDVDIRFNIVWYKDNSGVALLRGQDGNMYAFSTEGTDTSQYEPYAEREQIDTGQDEDGFADYEYGDWDLTSDVVEKYVNAEAEVGSGFGDYEDGKLSLVDDETKQDIMGLADYYAKNGEPNTAKELSGVLQGGLSERNMASKIVDTDRMMTPTGTLFFMSAMEEAVEEIKELINESKKNYKRRS